MNTKFKAVIATLAGVLLIAAVACGATATPSPVATQPPATTAPAPPTAGPLEAPEMAEVPAPIEKVRVIIAESLPVQYMLQITSGLPSGCAAYDGTAVEIVGKKVNVTVTNLMPTDPQIACTMIYGYHDSTVNLGAGLEPGETYTVIVNGQTTNAFTVDTPGGETMTIKPSPIKDVDLTINEDEYVLTVISRLPLGSSCSKFYGYDVDYRSAPEILVTVRHSEILEGHVPCSADLPVVITEIPLGVAPVENGERTVIVNGQVSVSVAVPEEVTEKPAGGGVPEGMEPVAAPIESAEIIQGDNAATGYELKIVSGLPSGCAQFYALGMDRSGNIIDVTVTNLVPNGPVACTAIYGYQDSAVGLGGGLEPGETYTVRVNGMVTNAFTVQDEEDAPMAVKDSPIEDATIARAEDGYTLTVVSRLPLGSSCSKFYGYDIGRRSGGAIQVTVKHLEVTEENVPCTRDLPAVVTEIPLGSDFAAGETYTVKVNGDTEASFIVE